MRGDGPGAVRSTCPVTASDYPGRVRLLAIDTSTSAITVAVHDGDRVLDRESVLDPRGHAEHLAPAVARVLARLELPPYRITHVVGGTGPGPFTGLRVGLMTAIAFGYAVGAPVGGLCSLDALAERVGQDAAADQALWPPDEFVVATDARRKEVYWARYRREEGPIGSGYARVSGPHVSRPGDLPGPLAELPVAGRGGLLYPAAFGPAWDVLDVDAADLAGLAVRVLAARGQLPPPVPLYLRRPDARPLPEYAADAADDLGLPG